MFFPTTTFEYNQSYLDHDRVSSTLASKTVLTGMSSAARVPMPALPCPPSPRCPVTVYFFSDRQLLRAPIQHGQTSSVTKQEVIDCSSIVSNILFTVLVRCRLLSG